MTKRTRDALRRRPNPARRADSPVPDAAVAATVATALPVPTHRSNLALVVFVAAYLLLGIGSCALIYGLKWNYPPIRSDGVGYYMYLPAVAVDHDLSFLTTTRRYFQWTGQIWPGCIVTEEGHWLLNKYPYGTALLMAPFYAAAYTVAALRGQAADIFAGPFQVASVASGLFYGAAGIVALWLFLRRHFDEWAVAAAMTAIVYGTNLFHHATYEGSHSHIYSFFAMALYLPIVARTRVRSPLWRYVLLGALAAGIFLVRPTNLVWTVTALAIPLAESRSVREFLVCLRAMVGRVTLAAAVAAVLIAPQILVWYKATGALSPMATIHAANPTVDGFDFARPEILNVLFSANKGLFFWAPVLVLAMAGLPFLARTAPAFAWPMLAAFVAQVYIVSSWICWWYGGSFGHRAFTEFSPFFACGLAALLQSARGRPQRRAILAATGLATLYVLYLMAKYWTNRLPFDRITWEYFTRTFFLW